jgi:sugar transferase EpsL
MIKRLFDILGSAAILILLSPLLLVVAAAVLVFLGTPVLFAQERPGLRGKIFRIHKFRTMTGERGPDGSLLTDAQRLTRFGRFLRASSLDELPEFWNVLRGDMSIVGPRPLLASYLERYTCEESRRHSVRPGVTGWAQVNGRNATGWEDRLRLDVWYVDNRSLWLDLRILYRTVSIVLNREGINSPLAATMPELRPSGGENPRQGSCDPNKAEQ